MASHGMLPDQLRQLAAAVGPGETTLSIVRAFVEAFPSSVLLSGLHSELILMGVNDSKLEIDPALVQARLESMPEVRADLERIHLGGLTEIIGAFAASGEWFRPSGAASRDFAGASW